MTAPSRQAPSLLAPPFVIAVVLLSVGALSGTISTLAGFNRIKQPLSLRAPLSMLQTQNLAPYKLIKWTVHSPEVINALGTDEYISWILEDQSVPRGDLLRFVHIDVTYYTGGHYLAPHTPDNCRVGGGYKPAVPHENLILDVPGVGLEKDRLPVRVCTFQKTDVFDRQEVSVVYTFFCNGGYVETARGVRLRVNDPTKVHTFFSKVEISFLGPGGVKAPSRAQNIEGAEKLFRVVLPVLMESHWPDFDAAEARARASKNPGAKAPTARSDGV